MARVLVIEENGNWKTFLSEALSSAHQVTLYSNGRNVSKRLQHEAYDVIILDLPPSQSDGIGFLQSLIKGAPYTPVIVTSQHEKTELVVKTIKAGAFDFVAKPYSADKIKLAVEQALEKRSLKNEIDYLRRQQDVIYDWERIIAVSPSMKKVISTIKKLARADSTVLMTGETGTGKSFLSGTIHFNSPRRSKPFIKINCANIPETLLESELFGHEKGAFTSADKTRAGRFEQAHGGTVFLDEIGELNPALQVKLLRVLEEKSFERLGGNRTIHSDIRIIAATNRDLEKQVAEGTFRKDLYYRVNVLRMHLPSLRERRECIEPLAYHLLEKTCRSVKKRIDGFSPTVIDLFRRYHWPGNIRELSNTIERAALLEDSRIIQKENVSLPESPVLSGNEGKRKTMQSLDMHEKDLIIEALEENLWIQKEAAKRLCITPRALNYKIKKYGISHPRWLKNK
jgi:DNA-binding NtrC family response regulator